MLSLIYNRPDEASEDIWIICGDFLEHHHEDYNIDLIDIMTKFEKALRQTDKLKFVDSKSHFIIQ